MAHLTCTECAAPLSGRQRTTCSKKCRMRRDARMRRAKPGFSEYKRAENAKYRGTKLLPRVEQFDCATCGKHCVPGENVAPHARKFCGDPHCKRAWHSPDPGKYKKRTTKPKPDPSTKLKWVSCRECDAAVVVDPRVGRPLGGWVKRRKNGWCCPNCPPGWLDNQTNIWTGGRCLQCSTPFLCRNAKLPKFCTDLCARRAAHNNRRVAKRDAFVANVYRADIYERDGYRCQLCNKPVNRDAVVPHPKAPVLDHIIPLAKGGTHEPANVQLAHFMCNSIKSDNIGGAGDQLRLIG